MDKKDSLKIIIVIALIIIALVLVFLLFRFFRANNPYDDENSVYEKSYSLKKNVCGNNVCETNENINNCKSDCKKVFISENSFGGTPSANEQGFEAANGLGIDLRGIFSWQMLSPLTIKKYDEIIKKIKYPSATISLMAQKKSTSSNLPGAYNGGYVLPSGNNLEQWKNVVKKMVDRYSGKNLNYGCVIDNKKDCYSESDGLYPDEETRNAIARQPVKIWQIENEWLSQVVDAKNNKQHAKDFDMIKYFIEIRKVIKNEDPDAKIMLGAVAGIDLIAGIDNYTSTGKIVWGDPDCRYAEKNINENFDFKSVLLEQAQREKYFIVSLKDYYDIIDFHSYYDYPYEQNYAVQWLWRIMQNNGIQGKEIWSTENAGPFHYFIFDNLAVPECPDIKTCYGSENAIYECTKGDYNATIHSSQIVERQVIDMANGVSKIFSAMVIWPFLGWSDNYVRNSLLDENGKKPVYYTYKLMSQKLNNTIAVEKIDDYVYKFSFTNKNPVFVSWFDSDKIIDLSNEISGNARVTHIISEYGKTEDDAVIENIDSSRIKIGQEPVFIE